MQTATARQLDGAAASTSYRLAPRAAWQRRAASSAGSMHAGVAAHASPAGPGPAAVKLEDKLTQGFLDWARQNKMKFSGLYPASFGGMRGVAVSDPIKADALLISCPRELAVTLPPKGRNQCPQLVTDAWWKSAPWFAKLGSVLLYQRSLGPKSPLAPYIQQLPTEQVPMTWAPSQLQALQYPHLIHQVKEQQNEWEQLYKDFTAGLAPFAAKPSKADFVWALTTVRSRTFSQPYIGSTVKDRARLLILVAFLAVTNTLLGFADLEKTLSAAIAVFVFNILYEIILSQNLKQYAMCPLIDFINHSSTVQSEVTYDYFGDCYSVAASREYVKGEQLLISYGAQSNDSLMQFYGFAEADNPLDCYVMTNLLKWLDTTPGGGVATEQARLDALNSAGLLTALQTVTLVRSGFPAETLQALRFLLAPQSEAAGGVARFVAAGSADIESRLASVLVHAVQSELRSMGTSLEEDQAALSGAAPSGKGAAGAAKSGHERSALAFRIEKKKVLRALLANLGVPSAAPSHAAAGPSNASKGSGGSSSGKGAGAGDASASVRAMPAVLTK